MISTKDKIIDAIVAILNTVAFLTFFFGAIFTGVSLGEAWMPIVGWIIVLAIVGIFTGIIIKNRKKFKAEYELKAKN